MPNLRCVLLGAWSAWPAFAAGAQQPAPEPTAQASPERGEVPVTIKELDVAGAMHEFEAFHRQLETYRDDIAKGKKTAADTAQILDELRRTATPANDYNQAQIMEAIRGYVTGVVAKQVGLVDFLESQRYRISYYANQMAASVRPEDLVLLFGDVEQNRAAVGAQVRAVESLQHDIAAFVDRLPADQLDRKAFTPLAAMPAATRRELDNLLYRYQQARNAQALATSRLKLVLEMQRKNSDAHPQAPDINPDLLLGQMFGALDRIRLQMSVDLLYLENFLGRYAQSARTAEILQAFQRLVQMQGGLEGPSPGLASVLDWLQSSSFRLLQVNAEGLGPAASVPRSADLLREAYEAATSGKGSTSAENQR